MTLAFVFFSYSKHECRLRDDTYRTAKLTSVPKKTKEKKRARKERGAGALGVRLPVFATGTAVFTKFFAFPCVYSLGFFVLLLDFTTLDTPRPQA